MLRHFWQCFHSSTHQQEAYLLSSLPDLQCNAARTWSYFLKTEWVRTWKWLINMSCEKTSLSKASLKQGLQHSESRGFPQADSAGMLCFFSLNIVIREADRDNGYLSLMLCSVWKIYSVQLCDLLKANTILLCLWSKQNGEHVSAMTRPS